LLVNIKTIVAALALAALPAMSVATGTSAKSPSSSSSSYSNSSGTHHSTGSSHGGVQRHAPTHHASKATPGTHPTKYESASMSSDRAPGVHRDSHGKIKRDPEQRSKFMKSHPCPSTGRTYGACPGYVVDHVQALKHGGRDNPSNMQWQTTAEAKAKDKWE
jgi:hypothetical protein